MLLNFTNFLFGLVVGLLIEMMAVYFYKAIDPKQKNDLKLILVILLQLYVIFWAMENMFINDFYSRAGMLTSQVFIFNYGMKIRLFYYMYPDTNYKKVKDVYPTNNNESKTYLKG